MIEEENVNKINSNYSFKGTHIYSLKDSLPQVFKKKMIDLPFRRRSEFTTMSIKKMLEMFFTKFSPKHISSKTI